MTTATPDVPDFDIEAMMAELDAQTAEIIAATAAATADPVVVAEPEPVISPKMLPQDEPAAKVVEPNAEELELAAAIAAQINDDEPFPNPADLDKAALDAEQELDLDEVFNAIQQDVVTAAVTLPVEEKVEVEPAAAVEIEPDQPVAVEAAPEVAVEAAPEIELEDKTIPDFKPKPAETPERSEETIMELSKLKYQPDIDSFNREIAFTDATLDVAMTSQASLVAYQNERAARSSAQASRLKLKFDSIEAMLYEAYRKAFVEAGEKVTEKAIENAVRKDSRWRKAKEAVIEAEMYADIHKGFVFALKDRNDMLIQRGSYRRQEMQGQMRVSSDLTPNPAQSNNIANSSGHAAAVAAMKKAQNS